MRRRGQWIVLAAVIASPSCGDALPTEPPPIEPVLSLGPMSCVNGALEFGGVEGAGPAGVPLAKSGPMPVASSAPIPRASPAPVPLASPAPVPLASPICLRDGVCLTEIWTIEIVKGPGVVSSKGSPAPAVMASLRRHAPARVHRVWGARPTRPSDVDHAGPSAPARACGTACRRP